MHRAAHYLKSRFPAGSKKSKIESYILTAADAAAISAALPIDANDYYYSACMSVADGLRGIEVGFYTWPTVKLYYSVFYAIRAILAWDRIAVFYPEAAPFHVSAIAGAIPKRISGKGTHRQVLNCFKNLNAGHYLLSQDIELIDVLDWLIEKREDANYAVPRFVEPSVPDYFSQIVRIGVRKAIAAYLGPDADIFSFDKDHAIVAFPLAALRCAGAMAKSHGGAILDENEAGFLKLKCRERSGALAPLLSFITGTLRP